MYEKIAALCVQLQRTVVPRQKVYARILFSITIALVLFSLTSSYLITTNPDEWMWLAFELGGTLGTIAAVLFCLTLLPSIMQRLRWFPAVTMPLTIILTLFRRQLGILMFITAWVHMGFTTTLPNIVFTGSPIPVDGLRLFEFYGFVAWIVLLPVWLTSNDFSMGILGRAWKFVQRLTYFSIWFIFLHVALQSEGIAILVGVTAILEVYSWIVQKRR